MQNFSELPISPYVQDRLSFAGFSIPTPVQAAAIPQALAGKDVLVVGNSKADTDPVVSKSVEAIRGHEENSVEFSEAGG